LVLSLGSQLERGSRDANNAFETGRAMKPRAVQRGR